MGTTRDLILFDSWGGHFSDNPRAISEALHARGERLRQCWVLADDVAGPPWAERVAPGGSEHVRRLGEARIVVANNLMPRYRKPADQTVLQTWHGTPLKRIGFDLRNGDPQYLEHLAHESRLWDLLLSPNAWSTPRLRSGLGYSGRVLEGGSPRNDLLAGPDADTHRARARRDLGLPEDAHAVLYAPTFRRAGRFDLRLDPGALADALGPVAHVLVRMHHFAPETHLRPHPHVRDVTREPDDVRDLLLAADALVTDYSSVMVDFALTGRPIVLFADDLTEYRDRLHGFNVDLEAIAPGPIVTSTIAVAEAIRQPADYETFAAQFCAQEDGGASDRVLDAVLDSNAR